MGHESQEGVAGASGKGKRGRAAGKDGDDNAPPDHYATLGINRRSSLEKYVLSLSSTGIKRTKLTRIAKAAKEMRIKTHPDRLKRNPELTPEALARIDADAARVG